MDPDLIWNRSVPQISDCFQQTVFIYIPAIYISIFGLYDVFKTRSFRKAAPWTLLSVSKILFLTLLVLSNVVSLSKTIIERDNEKDLIFSHVVANVIEIISFIIVLILVLDHKKKNVHTSGFLFFFWLFYAIFDLIIFVLITLDNYTISNDAFSTSKFDFIYKVLHTALTVACFLLCCISDYTDDSEKSCPRNSASLLSKLVFWWYNGLIWSGYKKTLTENDFWHLDNELKAKNAYCQFHKEYAKEFLKSKKEKKSDQKTKDVSFDKLTNNPIKLKNINILNPFFKTYRASLIKAACFKLLSVFASFAQPFLLDLILHFIRSEDKISWKGYYFTIIILLASVLESLLDNQYEYFINVVALKFKAALTSTIYKKSLVLSSVGRKEFTTGEISNLMSIDVQRIVDYLVTANLVWANFLTIVISMCLLCRQLGVAAIPGIGIMFFMFLPHSMISKQFKKLQAVQMINKDERSKTLNESLSGIKVLKVYAWTEAFVERIKQYRNNEIKSLRRILVYFSLLVLTFNIAPLLQLLASFSTYMFTYTDFKDQLDANKIFVSLSLFNIIRLPLGQIPLLIANAMQSLISIKRINKYLSSDELEDKKNNKGDDKNYPIKITGSYFAWDECLDKSNCTLKDINIRVRKNALTAIVGSIGSGKSSLFSAILNEMKKVEGSVSVSDSIAYASQIPWILNDTVKNNILFGKEFNKRKYDEVIEKARLKDDLKILDAGDETEIGEKGINLSGGQKQRVSLARAIYSDKSIYLFDDPLSALDSNVGKEVFDNVISNEGMLRNKTRLLVTHRITMLNRVDYIIFMKNGKIVEQGTYKELMESKGDFSSLVLQFLTEIQKDPIDNLEMQLIESDGIITNELNRSGSIISRSSIKLEEDKKIEKSQQESLKLKRKGKLIEAEKMEVGRVDRKVYLEYLRAMKISYYLLTILCYIISHGFNVALQLWLSAWSNDSNDLNNFNNTSLRNLRLIGYAGFGFGELVFVFLSVLIISLACLKASEKIHNLMLVNVFRAPMSFFDMTPQGRLLNRFTRDVDTADFSLFMAFRGVILYVCRVFVSFAIISMQTYWFIVTLIPIIILYIIIQTLYIALSRQLKRLESTSRSPVFSHFEETISGSSSIRAFDVENRFVEECWKRVDRNHLVYYPNICAVRWLSIRLEFLGYSIVFLSSLFAIVFRDSLSPGIVGISVTTALTITKNLDFLIKAFSDLETNIVSVERCLEYTKVPSEKLKGSLESKLSSEWPTQGLIEFKSYSTKYRPDLDFVLKEVSFRINPGEKVGVVGRTGAGKSTITLSLFRIIESANNGKIIIDGVDISKLDLNDLRSRLSIIPQDPVLFSGTIRLNLDPFGTYTDDELFKALEQAHLKKFIIDQKDGLNYVVTEGGENLSIGQRQLVCLARALLRRSKILVLDEATANVDLETDELIQNTIRTEFSNCTICTIAHRLNTIMDYNKILVLDQGRVAEYDSPQALLNDKDTIFYSMAKKAGLAL